MSICSKYIDDFDQQGYPDSQLEYYLRKLPEKNHQLSRKMTTIKIPNIGQVTTIHLVKLLC